MKKLKYLALLAAFSVVGIFVGCSGTDAKKGGDESTGTAIMALQGTSGGDTYCVTGNIVITDAVTDAVVATVPTDCGDTVPHSVILLPGNYEATVPTPVCTYTDVDNDNDNEFLGTCVQNPTPAPFSVALASTTPLTLTFDFAFESQQQSTVVFGVGAASISLGTPTSVVTTMCGDDPMCAVGSSCYKLNGAAAEAQCYAACDFVEGDANGGLGTMMAPMVECATGSCIPVLPQGSPTIGSELDLDLVPGACVDMDDDGAGGAGGAGAGGAPSDGGAAGEAGAGGAPLPT